MDIHADWQPAIVKSLAEQMATHDIATLLATHAPLYNPYVTWSGDPHTARIAGKRLLVRPIEEIRCPVCGGEMCEVENNSAKAASPTWGRGTIPVICRSNILVD